MIEELHRDTVYLFKHKTQYTGIYSCAVPGHSSLSQRQLPDVSAPKHA